MSFLQKYLGFVKEQVAFQQRMLLKFPDDEHRQRLHKAAEGKFRALADDLVVADKMLDELPVRHPMSPKAIRLSLTPQDLEGLPDDILQELSISSGDKTELTVLNLLEEMGGIATLDHLIIGLFRKTGEKYKRQTLTSKLYRMSQKEMIFSVPTKKGVYSNRSISEEEAKKLFSGD